ncbi:hypothetical protein Efla_007852 [Eimeria flavescens]
MAAGTAGQAAAAAAAAAPDATAAAAAASAATPVLRINSSWPDSSTRSRCSIKWSSSYSSGVRGSQQQQRMARSRPAVSCGSCCLANAASEAAAAASLVMATQRRTASFCLERHTEDAPAACGGFQPFLRSPAPEQLRHLLPLLLLLLQQLWKAAGGARRQREALLLLTCLAEAEATACAEQLKVACL